MRTRLRDTWAAGKAGVNAWLSMPNTVSAEITARQDLDSVTIDLQHGLNDYQAALSMLQAMEPGTATPMCRVPWLEPGIIMKVLDAGALGIICPMVNTPEDAEALVHWANYAPRGTRSFGPTRAVMAYGADYPSKANAAVVTLAMIETVQALENVEAIVATRDLTGVYIGPSDLSLSMGRTPKLDQDDPEVVKAIENILAAAKSAGVRAGIHCISTDYAKQMIAKGFDLVTVGGSDIRIYTAALAERVAAMRS